MIHKFKVENFYSINEEQVLDFTSKKKYSGSYGKFKKYYIGLVNCFVGANASGKTNLFRALSFLLWFAENSYYRVSDNPGRLFSPHKLRENENTNFEVIFDMNDNLFRYNLSLTVNSVVSEKLEIKSQKGFSYIYKLENENGKISIKYNRNNNVLSKINPTEEARFKKSKKMVTFFSFLIGIGYFHNIGLTGITKEGFRNVYSHGSISLDSSEESIILSKELEKSKNKDKILSYLKSFDLGIEDYVQDVFKARIKDEMFNLIGFKHSNHDRGFKLPIFDESAGTIKGLYLLLNLLNVLLDGGIAIIDELDSRLHYEIAKTLVNLFTDKDLNKKNAQLFFSTHQPLFLNDRDKSQIFLAYKEDSLNTEIYRLDAIPGIRNTENFFEKYLTGEYGAIPRIGDCL